jgi:hypothetical protein
LAEDCKIWTVHSQVFDTMANKTILERIAAGQEVWWYVNHAPPRPYANFLLEFEPLEHRALFWQTWALGVRGLHYRSVNDWAAGQDPFENLLDVTPANGDGILVYPGEDGPVNSIRWETIRDGIEDFDYLALLMSRLRALRDQGGNLPVLERALEVADLEVIIPNLVTFTRDTQAFQSKRVAMGRMIVELQRAPSYATSRMLRTLERVLGRRDKGLPHPLLDQPEPVQLHELNQARPREVMPVFQLLVIRAGSARPDFLEKEIVVLRRTDPDESIRRQQATDLLQADVEIRQMFDHFAQRDHIVGRIRMVVEKILESRVQAQALAMGGDVFLDLQP